jgi:hypothetical protein
MKYPTRAEFDAYPPHGGSTPRQRLLASYVIEATGCWRWTKALTTVGYGHFHFAGRYYQAHRLMYVLHRGPTDAETIDHLCRNRWCVNPAHLEPVTHRENIRRGSRTRLNPERVALIHELSDRGYSLRQIGRLMRVDHTTVYRVLSGERWTECLPAKEGVAA